MASDASFVQHVVDQLAHAGHIDRRRMFGEYAIYCDTKVVGLVVRNQFYLKPTDAGKALLEHPVEVAPFEGAKKWLLIDDELENAVYLGRLVRATADALPLPVPKRKPGAKSVGKRPARRQPPGRRRRPAKPSPEPRFDPQHCLPPGRRAQRRKRTIRSAGALVRPGRAGRVDRLGRLDLRQCLALSFGVDAP